MSELKGSSLPCPVPGCPRLRKREHLMCFHHWRHTPRHLQRGIWDQVGRPKGRKAYKAFVAKAVAHLAARDAEARP